MNAAVPLELRLSIVELTVTLVGGLLDEKVWVRRFVSRILQLPRGGCVRKAEYVIRRGKWIACFDS